MSVNKVILIGYLGQDPELKYTSDAIPVCNLSLATSEIWKDQNGKQQTRTEWHKLVLWRRLAEIASQYLKKGSQIYVEGKIQSKEFEDSTNREIKRKVYEIIVNELRMLDRKSSNDGN